MKYVKNRVFAIIFALIILTWMYYYSHISGFILLEICFLLIVVGLLVEAWKPSLDFTFHRNRTWTFMSIILFAVFILNSVYWWLAYGFPNWLPQWGWQATIVEYFMGSFAMETSSLSLMFGILFLTRSTPKKSLSYKIMLIGAVILEALCFITYLTAIAGGSGGPEQFVDFWEYTIFQPWFWLDLTSELVILIGAIWLFRKGK